MPTKALAANPAACKLCKRVAPEKCKRHGGKSHSTSGGLERIRASVA